VSRAPLIVGWHEPVALPDLGIELAYAKIDTGADTSTLHARDVRIVGEGATRLVKFTPPLLRHQSSCESWPEGGVRHVTAQLVEERIVRSSMGEDEIRVIIRTRLVLGPLKFEANFSLTSRVGLRFPVLIGRDALEGRVLVDPAKSHLLAGAPERIPAPPK
jgi:hypothetical protein